jgi:hypothetical protein
MWCKHTHAHALAHTGHNAGAPRHSSLLCVAGVANRVDAPTTNIVVVRKLSAKIGACSYHM